MRLCERPRRAGWSASCLSNLVVVVHPEAHDAVGILLEEVLLAEVTVAPFDPERAALDVPELRHGRERVRRGQSDDDELTLPREHDAFRAQGPLVDACEAREQNWLQAGYLY